ncbi:MAG: WYL domain-containing protein [Clostridia bacterium]|nr:WYL domain-containing protein [Clostridia bacterium]
MREFYVYGFKHREQYAAKSPRSYDDERRRVESWLGDHMGFVRTPEGKNVFLSIDSRRMDHNPLYKAWKAKSFTDGDITLHFILLDILHTPERALSPGELLQIIDREYLASFQTPMALDESTLRKKLKEYVSEGILTMEKQGKRVRYRRAADTVALPSRDVLDLFSEILPCGVIGSFLIDRTEERDSPFRFKHHYITGTLESDLMAVLFDAMGKGASVTVTNAARRTGEPKRVRAIPLRIYVSAQSGRQYLVAYVPEQNRIRAFRLDYLSAVKLEEPTPRFGELRAKLDAMEPFLWGVNLKVGSGKTEKISFTVKAGYNEGYIVDRLQREKRTGQVECLENGLYRFSAQVQDARELLPWIRTFLCRIVAFECSNTNVKEQFLRDLKAMYAIYGLGGDSV